MSRSYRKRPYLKDGYGTDRKQFYKEYFNSRIRHYCDDVPSGMSYRKYNQRWDMEDYVYHQSWKGKLRKYESDLKEYEHGGGYFHCWVNFKQRWSAPPEKPDKFDWYKHYKMK